MSAQLRLPFTSYQRPSGFVEPDKRRIAKPDTVSIGALLLFRLIERLSKRGIPGCVRNMPILAAMLEKPKGAGTYSERSVWKFWNELLAARWFDCRAFRKGGKSYLEFWPLVRVRAAGERIFLRKKTALKAAPSTPKNCTLAPHPTDSSELCEAEDDGMGGATGTPAKAAPAVQAPAAVSCPDGLSPELVDEAMMLCEEDDARQALRVAQKDLQKRGKSLTPEIVRQGVKAARAWIANQAGLVRPGAALTNALRGSWNPPAPPAVHASDKPRGAEEVKTFIVAEHPAQKALRETAAAGSDAWEALDESQRAGLLEAALREILETGSGAHKEHARKRGTGAMVVILRAKQMARGEGK